MSGIKKKQLSEIRSMANPPAIVKLALESICLLLDATEDKEVIPDWKTIRSILNKDSFIPSILNFDTTFITYAISPTPTRNKSFNFFLIYNQFCYALLLFFLLNSINIRLICSFYSKIMKSSYTKGVCNKNTECNLHGPYPLTLIQLL